MKIKPESRDEEGPLQMRRRQLNRRGIVSHRWLTIYTQLFNYFLFFLPLQTSPPAKSIGPHQHQTPVVGVSRLTLQLRGDRREIQARSAKYEEEEQDNGGREQGILFFLVTRCTM